MFNAEKLLGKVVQEVMDSTHGMKKKKKKKSSLVDNFTSGAGLMTAIGLGIGAYEILKDKSQPKTASQSSTPPFPATGGPPPISVAGRQTATPPPPPPPSGTTATPSRQSPPPQQSGSDTEKLAVRLIQVMVAAAHADGNMDADEEKAVIGRLKDENFSQEEKMFLLGEMHNPKSIDELTESITDPAVAKTMYMLSAGVIEIDTPEERQWLNDFAARLGLSKTVQDFIEEQA